MKFLALDFDGVLTDNIVYTSEVGIESVACWRSDGLGITKIQKLGIPIWVISSEKNTIVKKINFTHPYLNIKTFEMQKRLNSLQGKKRTWFSGSYFGYGFHEDGLKSSLEMLKQFEGKDGDMHIQGHSYASKI